jgi:hypothetical protein
MDLYKYGRWTDNTGTSFWAIKKKVWYGWKTIQYWSYYSWIENGERCEKLCLKAVSVMKEKGLIVMEG